MSENGRNRNEGWKHAKTSGHKNESMVLEDVKKNEDIQQRILRVAHADNQAIKEISVGGLHETDVQSVLGDATKSKADLTIVLESGQKIGVSIKKSLAGQVYLISPDRFVEGFEKQFQQEIPADVKKAIALYWGTDSGIDGIVKDYGTKNASYERRKHRLTGNTLRSYDAKLYDALLNWFEDNMVAVFEFCFSKGLASQSGDWADLVWYKNELGETGVDAMFNVHDVKKYLSKKAEYSKRTGGSTIHLPFGFVQWHSPKKTIPGDMQFHHSYKKLVDEIQDYMDFLGEHQDAPNKN